MSYLVLARRWRPQKFADLVGQDVVVRTLKNAITGGNLAHAYLLCGIRGVGKTTIARLMAMSVNCESPVDGEPCGVCAACRAIASGSSLDVQEMDAASHTGVDDVREILDGVRYPPSSLKFKVYIIDEAHMLSKSAFNALLKTLEEPPAQVLFILATTESEKLPVTVRSRCQRFDLRTLGQLEISNYLQHVFNTESVDADADAVAAIARAADGSVRDALSLAERVLAYSDKRMVAADVLAALGMVGSELVNKLCEALFAADGAAAVTLLRDAAGRGHAPRTLLLELARLWHQLACLQVDASLLGDEIEAGQRDWLQAASAALNGQALDLRYQVLLSGIRDLVIVDERLGAEMVLMRLCGLNAIAPVAKLDLPEAAAASTAGSTAELREASRPASPEIPPEAPAHLVQQASESLRQEQPRPEPLPSEPVQPEPVLSEPVAPQAPEETPPWDTGHEPLAYLPQDEPPQSEPEPQPVPHAEVASDEPDLPMAEPEPVSPESFENWQQAVDAFGRIRPGVSAMLDHVVCQEFGSRVRLALDKHQERAITAADRMAFAEWLGRDVQWVSRQGQEGETLSQERDRQARAETARLRRNAEEDPHVQALMREMNAELVRVSPAGANTGDGE